MRDRDVVNYSAEDERVRLTLRVLVTYESDVDEARQLMERGAREVEEVVAGGPDIRIGSARYPAKPTAYIDSYGDHGIHLTLRYWATRPYKLLTVRSEVQTRLRSLLAGEDADVEVAYPHQHLHFDETSGEARVAVREGAARGEGGGRGSVPDDASATGGPDSGAAPTGEDPTDGGPAPGS